MVTDEKLLELSLELLNEDGQIDVEDLLETGKRRNAIAYLQGAVDRKLDDGKISIDRFNEIRFELGLSDGKLEDLRSHHAQKEKLS